MKRNNLNFKNSNESSLQHKKSISPKYSINTTPKNIKHKTQPSTLPLNTVKQIPKITSYKLAERLRLTNTKLKQIRDKIQIQFEAQRQYQNRYRNNNLYVQYSYNPLTSQVNKQRSMSESERKNNLINLLSNKQKSNIEKGQQRLAKIKKQLTRFYIKISQNTNPKIINHSIKQPVINNIIERYNPIRNDLQDLQDIIKLPQTSYFKDKYYMKQSNIFKIIKGNFTFKTNKQTLDKLNFCSDSIVLPISKLKNIKKTVNPIQFISTYSRSIINHHQMQPKSNPLSLAIEQLHSNISNMQFEDIMIITNGKVSPHILRIYLQEQQVKQKQQIVQDDGVEYKNGLIHQSINFNGVDQDKTQISYYKIEPFNKNQEKEQKILLSYRQKLSKMCKNQRLIRSNGINDENVLQKLRKQRQKLLLIQLSDNSDIMKQSTQNNDKKIRLNKIFKNKTQRIKINSVISSLKLIKPMKQKQPRNKQNKIKK